MVEGDLALTSSKCTTCRAGEPTVSDQEIQRLKPQIPEWIIVERDGIRRLKRTFRFKNFAEGSFTNNVGKIAVEEGQHLALLSERRKVTVTWRKHKIKGLHRNDFFMASKTDRAYG